MKIFDVISIVVHVIEIAAIVYLYIKLQKFQVQQELHVKKTASNWYQLIFNNDTIILESSGKSLNTETKNEKAKN